MKKFKSTKSKIIVSLTSYPKRIKVVHNAIKSIIEQTMKADKIILWLAEEEFPNKEKDLPYELLCLKDFGLVIDWCDDIKSYKKLIPTLKKYPNDIIVTADDDNIYPKYWLEKLYNSYLESPKCISAHRVTKFYYDNEFKIIAGGNDYYSPSSCLNKLVGLGGVLYPPHCFYKDILNEELFMKLAPTNDDQWFWVQAVLNGYTIKVVDKPEIVPNYIEGTQEFGLYNINDHGEKLFWKDFNRLINYYPKFLKRLKKESSDNNFCKENSTLDVDIIESTDIEINKLNYIKNDYKKHSEMSEQDRLFITSIINRYKPKKLLEVGVYKGGSSIVILNAIKDIKGAQLFSCDYHQMCYKDNSKKTGYIVDEYSELKEKWSLYTGGFVCNHLDKIGKDIDFCLLDTVHSNPGEILDFLMVLPYLKDNAIVLLHDTNLHARITDNQNIKRQFTTNLLTSTILGQKIIPSSVPYEPEFIFPNISAIKINKKTKKHIYEVFNLLTLPWTYKLSERDVNDFLRTVSINYNEYYLNYMKKVIQYQHSNIEGVDYSRIYKSIDNQKQKTYLWGASIFLENLQKIYSIKNPNIIGIIDKNPDKWGKKLGEYTIFSPEILKKEKDVCTEKPASH